MSAIRKEAWHGLFAAAVLLGTAMVSGMQAPKPPRAAKAPTEGAGEYRISPPHTHKNLAIYLISSVEGVRGKTPMTLEEALKQKKVVVHETGDVNKLAVENLSPDEEIYIQSGDILKGGNQDRTLTTDLIVPPSSGRMPIAAFCVEQGRWRPRGKEAATYFSTSNAQLATKSVKLAAKYKADQQEVWKEVAGAEARLAYAVGAPATAMAPTASFQLTLENRKVQESMDEYLKALSPIIQGARDVVGFAFAINGKISSADVYGNSALFQKLWPKLLRASVVEALAESREAAKAEPPHPDLVRTFLADAQSGRPTQRQASRRIRSVMRESEKNLLFETRDKDQGDGTIHKSYIAK